MFKTLFLATTILGSMVVMSGCTQETASTTTTTQTAGDATSATTTTQTDTKVSH